MADFYKAPFDKWPRLSVTLGGPKQPDRCQACGLYNIAAGRLTRWRECDQFDHPEKIIVVLCKPCSTKLIEKHPRLYQALELHAPSPPGTAGHDICLGCRHRDGVTCTSPEVLSQGGVDLRYADEPSTVHIHRSKGQSGWTKMYHDEPASCSGFEAVKDSAS